MVRDENFVVELVCSYMNSTTYQKFFVHDSVPLTLFIPASETTDFYRGGVISPPQKIRFSRSLECTKIDATSHT